MGDPTRTAVLVVDLQVGVLRGCHDPMGTVARTRELVERARREGAPVVWVLDHSEFEPETPDWQLPSPLRALAGEPVIRKRYRDAFCETHSRARWPGSAPATSPSAAPSPTTACERRRSGRPRRVRRDAGRGLPHLVSISTMEG